ncbi:MAG TPA: NUDIX domain-containing protein [Patescibacteria group bacterium]
MKEKILLVGAAVVYRKANGKTTWFLVKQKEDSDWELPKTTARRGESSVRAVIRAMGEQGGMRAKVLEEVGRGGGAAMLGGRTVPQRYLYYLMINKEGKEVLGFAAYDWFEYGKAIKKLTTKRDQAMLRGARDLLKKLEAEKKKKKK